MNMSSHLERSSSALEVVVRGSETYLLWVREDFSHMHGDGHLVDPQVWVGGNYSSAGEVHSFPREVSSEST